MLKNVMGIIKLMENEELLRQLAYDRTVAAIPFGGRYRLIDFTLSNMVNSGIANVGLFPQRKHRSLVDHVRSGKPWDLNRKREGLFILPADANNYHGTYRGDMESLNSHIDYLNRSSQEYVLMTNSNMVCNLDYRKVYQFHRDIDADITIIYKEDLMGQDVSPGVVLELEEDQRVVSLEVNPRQHNSTMISMDMYLMKRSLLLDIMDTCIARGQYDFVQDGLIKNLAKLKVYGYRHEGYLGRITSVVNYYMHSLELLQPSVWQELFFRHGMIYTKVKDEAPSKYLEGAQVENSMVASGCLIQGKVENSILFRGVKVAQGAHVKNSVIMPKGVINQGVKLNHVILDKEVTISQGKVLSGDPTYPIVIGRNAAI